MNLIIQSWDLESKTVTILQEHINSWWKEQNLHLHMARWNQSPISSHLGIKRAFDGGCDPSPPLTPALKRVLLNSGTLIMPSNLKLQGKKGKLKKYYFLHYNQYVEQADNDGKMKIHWIRNSMSSTVFSIPVFV